MLIQVFTDTDTKGATKHAGVVISSTSNQWLGNFSCEKMRSDICQSI